jgi:hypothetical protein
MATNNNEMMVHIDNIHINIHYKVQKTWVNPYRDILISMKKMLMKVKIVILLEILTIAREVMSKVKTIAMTRVPKFFIKLKKFPIIIINDKIHQ